LFEQSLIEGQGWK